MVGGPDGLPARQWAPAYRRGEPAAAKRRLTTAGAGGATGRNPGDRSEGAAALQSGQPLIGYTTAVLHWPSVRILSSQIPTVAPWAWPPSQPMTWRYRCCAPTSVPEATVADESSGDAGAGEEVVGLAFVPEVDSATAREQDIMRSMVSSDSPAAARTRHPCGRCLGVKPRPRTRSSPYPCGRG